MVASDMPERDTVNVRVAPEPDGPDTETPGVGDVAVTEVTPTLSPTVMEMEALAGP